MSGTGWVVTVWSHSRWFHFARGGQVWGAGMWWGVAGPGAHLHHEHDGVEGDHGHDGVLKRRRHHKLPHAVLEALLVLGHVSGQRFGADGEVDAGPLWETGQWREGQRRRAPDTEHPLANLARLSATSCPQLGFLDSTYACHDGSVLPTAMAP